MLKLYELTHEYENLIHEIQDFVDENGEISPEFIAEMDKIQSDFSEKCRRIIEIIRNLEAEAISCETEEKRFQKRKKIAQNTIEWLKSYMLNNMEKTHKDKLEAGPFKLSVRLNAISLVVDEEQVVPESYRVIKYDLDKSKIKEDLKNGIMVPGARLYQKTSIQIK